MTKYNKDGSVDIEFEHPVYGLIPSTVSPDDPDLEGLARWDAVMAGEYGAIEPYVPPTADAVLAEKRAQAVMTRMAFLLALDTAGLYDSVEAVVNDAATPRRIKIMWENASTFERMHPDLITIGLSDTDMDVVFGI